MLKKTDLRGYFKSKDGKNSWESKPILNSFFKNNADEIKEWEDSGILSKALNKKDPEIADALIRAVLLSMKSGLMTVSQGASIFDTFKSLMTSRHRFQYKHRSYTLDGIFEGDSGDTDWLEIVQMLIGHRLFFKNPGSSELQYRINFSSAELFQVTVSKIKRESDPQKRQRYLQFLREDAFLGLMPRDGVMSTFVGLAGEKNTELFDQIYLYLVERFKNPGVKVVFRLPLTYFPRSSFATHYYDDMTNEEKEKIKHVCRVVIQSDVFFDRQNENWSSCNWLFDSHNAFSLTSEWDIWKEVLNKIKIRSSSEITSHSYSLGYTLMKSAFGKFKDIVDPDVKERLQKQKEADLRGLKNFFEFYQGKSAEEVLSLILELQNSWRNAFNYALPLQTDRMFEEKVSDHFWRPLLALVSPFAEDDHSTAKEIVAQSWVLLQQMIPEALRGTHNSEVEFDCERLGLFMKENGWDVVSWVDSNKAKVGLLGGLLVTQPLLASNCININTVELERIRYPFMCWLNNIGNAQKYDGERYMKKNWDGFLVPVCELLMKDRDANEVMDVVNRLMEKRALLCVEKLLHLHQLTPTNQQQYKMIHSWLASSDYKEGEPLRLYGLFETVLNKDFEQMMDVVSTDFSALENNPKRFNKLLSDVLGSNLSPNVAEKHHLDFIERQYERKREGFNSEQRKDMIEQLGLQHWHEKFKKIYELDMLKYLDERVSKKNLAPSVSPKIERF